MVTRCSFFFLPPAVGALSIWDIEKGNVIKDIAGPFTPKEGQWNVPHFLSVSAKGDKAIATARIAPGMDAAILYSLKDGKILHNIDHNNKKNFDLIISGAISPDGKLFALGTTKSRVYIYDTQSGKLVKLFKHSNVGRPMVTALAFSPDSKFIASGGAQVGARAYETPVPTHFLSVWKVSDTSLVASYPLTAVGDLVEQISWSPNGRILAFAGNGYIRVWMPSHPDNIDISVKMPGAIAAAISPDGKYLAVNGAKDLKIFDMISVDQFYKK